MSLRSPVPVSAWPEGYRHKAPDPIQSMNKGTVALSLERRPAR